MNSDNELDEFTDFEEIVYGFQGRRLDSETNGLMYFRNRYYNPKLGRFLQRDSLEYIDSYGLYEAFGGNPYDFLDPSGNTVVQSSVTNQKGFLSRKGNFIYTKKGGWLDRSHIDAGIAFINSIYKQMRDPSAWESFIGCQKIVLKDKSFRLAYIIPIVMSVQQRIDLAKLIAYDFSVRFEALQGLVETIIMRDKNSTSYYPVEDLPSTWLGIQIGAQSILSGKKQQKIMEETISSLEPVGQKEALLLLAKSKKQKSLSQKPFIYDYDYDPSTSKMTVRNKPQASTVHQIFQNKNQEIKKKLIGMQMSDIFNYSNHFILPKSNHKAGGAKMYLPSK